MKIVGSMLYDIAGSMKHAADRLKFHYNSIPNGNELDEHYREIQGVVKKHAPYVVEMEPAPGMSAKPTPEQIAKVTHSGVQALWDELMADERINLIKDLKPILKKYAATIDDIPEANLSGIHKELEGLKGEL